MCLCAYVFQLAVNRKVIRVFLVASLLWSFNSSAQDSTSNIPMRRWAITFRPLGAVSLFLTNYTFGLQYKATKKIVVEVDAGWIQTWFYMSTANADNISSSGFRLGGELKYVIWHGMYIAVQGFYNDYTKSSEEYVWRFGETYEEKMDVERFITSWGAHTKGGFILQRPDKNFFFDFYAGLGFRQKTILIPGLPEDAAIIEDGEFDQPPGTYVYPSVTMGFAIGYTF
jgi:hypothetical protein